jgi:hypothetical protein
MHGSPAGVQSLPFSQATQVPDIEHTPVGHGMPGAFKPERWQTGAPVEHAIV